MVIALSYSLTVVVLMALLGVYICFLTVGHMGMPLTLRRSELR